jgi:hypothetical protein
LNIPERYEDVTAEWLTEALRSGGVIGDQTVSTFEVHPLGADVSRASSLAKITVEYDGLADGLPDSMFVKFVSRIPGNREFFTVLGHFRREIELYKNLGDAIPMNMPKLYFGLAADDSDVAVIILEEIKAISKAPLPLEQQPLTAGEAKLALREVSKMHAKWWEDRTIYEHEWLLRFDDDRRMSMYQSHNESWAKLRNVLEPALSPAEVRICSGLSSYLPTLIPELRRMPLTLRHGDFHFQNMLWDELGEPGTVWAIDWQAPGIGPAILDVSWFLGLGVAKADLPFIRQTYLPEYHAALVSSGVTDYEYSQFLSDYSHGLLEGLTRMIGLLANLDAAREDSVEFIRLLVGNLAAGAVDAGCADLIS